MTLNPPGLYLSPSQCHPNHSYLHCLLPKIVLRYLPRYQYLCAWSSPSRFSPETSHLHPIHKALDRDYLWTCFWSQTWLLRVYQFFCLLEHTEFQAQRIWERWLFQFLSWLQKWKPFILWYPEVYIYLKRERNTFLWFYSSNI